MNKVVSVIIASTLAFTISSCSKKPTNPQDPYENFNRFVFGFNTGVDHLVLRPVTRVYDAALPGPIRRGVRNILRNFASFSDLPNDLLQGKLRFFFTDTARILVNTSIGIGGMFDIASRLKIPKHEQGTALTLAYYTNPQHKSPYLVLPILGPYTFRSSLGALCDYFMMPLSYLKSDTLKYSLMGLRVINIRSQLMPLNPIVDSSFDPYVFVRNAYLKRNARIIKKSREEIKPTFKDDSDDDNGITENRYGIREDDNNTDPAEEEKDTNTAKEEIDTSTAKEEKTEKTEKIAAAEEENKTT